LFEDNAKVEDGGSDYKTGPGLDNRTSVGNKGNPETALSDHSCKASIKYVGFLEFFSSSSTTVFEGTTVAKSMRYCDNAES